MKLSEILQAEADDAGGHGETFGREHRSDLEHYAALARALEERVAELEAASRAKGVGIKAFSSQLAAANARAEVAEAEVARQIKLAMGYADERDALREANAVTRERALQSEEIALTAIDKGDALRAKLEKVRAAVRVPTCSSYEKSYDAAYAALTLVESILDGEGDNEA